MHERRGGGQADYLQVDASLPMATAQKMRIWLIDRIPVKAAYH